MALKPASTFIASRSPIVDSNGNATFAFTKILQGWSTQLQNGLDELGQLIGQINAATKIAGRTEGIGTTVGNIDSAGTVTALGVDLSRPYLNKTTDHINDGTGSPLAGGIAAHAALTASSPVIGDYLQFNGITWVPVMLPPFPLNIAATPSNWVNSYTASTGTFTKTQPNFTDVAGQIATAQLPASGLSVTITTAKLTVGGANGSMTFTNGILTAQVQAT